MDMVFVGREQQLVILADALDSAIGGGPQVVVCRGEPGIGKTRLAQEASQLSRARKVAVAWGTGIDSEGAPPYWPWTQVLRALDATEITAVAAEQGLVSDLGALEPRLFGGAREDRDTAAVGAVRRATTRRIPEVHRFVRPFTRMLDTVTTDPASSNQLPQVVKSS